MKNFLILIMTALALVASFPANIRASAPAPTVVGGQDALAGQFPYQARLHYQDGNMFCGGALIDRSWVLTAAHCVTNDSEDIYVTLNDLYRSTIESGEQTFRVVQRVVHPAYTGAYSGQPDLALLRLQSPATVGAPITLLTLVEENQIAASGATLRLSGWGCYIVSYCTLVQGAGYISEQLRWRDFNFASIDETHFRTAGVGISGQGDSGGPVTVLINGTRKLAAGVSTCCSFPRIAPHIEWIRRVIGQYTLPSSGTPQAMSSVNVGAVLQQGVWINNQGWYRSVPIINGQVDFANAPAWSGPLPVSTLPGSGSVTAQSDAVTGSSLLQAIWRGNIGYYRTVPVVSGQVQWGLAAGWSSVSPGSLPGAGEIQAQSDVAIGNTYWQAIWRGGVGYYRAMNILSGQVQWHENWQAAGIETMPGYGAIDFQDDFVQGSNYHQVISRGGITYARVAPIVNGVVNWASASAWQ